MIKFFKKAAHKIFGHHKHHDATPSGPVPVAIAINQAPVEKSVKPAQQSPSGLGRRTKDTLREATVFAPESNVKIEEKAKDIALQLESLHEAKAQQPVQEREAPKPVQDIKEAQKPEIIQKAVALQIKHHRQPQISEGEGIDAFGLNGALVKSPFEDDKGNKKPVLERTKIMDSLQKGESTYKLKVKPH